MSNPTQLWIPSRLESINSKLELRQCWNAWIRMGQLPDIGDRILWRSWSPNSSVSLQNRDSVTWNSVFGPDRKPATSPSKNDALLFNSIEIFTIIVRR
jgi:hypothetical protein